MSTLGYLIGNKPIYKWLNHRSLYLLGLATILAGLGWSNFLMSLGQLIVLGNWIIEFSFKQKLKKLYSHQLFWVLISFYLLHIVGLLYTDDLDYAFKDLLIKLPLISLPFLIASSPPLKKVEWKGLLFIYLSCLFILTLVSYGKLFNEATIDKRELSINISHIRYGLNIAFAAILSFHYRKLVEGAFKNILLFISLWMLTALILFEMYTGLFCFLAVLLSISIYQLIKSHFLFVKLIAISGLTASFFFLFTTVNTIWKDFQKEINLSYDQEQTSNAKTLNNEFYHHELNNPNKENGVYVRRFIAWKELEKEWDKRSDIGLHDRDLKGQVLNYTLCRYLSSRGLKKDSVGISKLSDREVKAIERGVANHYYLSHNAFENRIHQTFYEIDRYRESGYAEGYSLVMRYVYWKTAIHIIEKNLIIGVGTGDIPTAFDKQYKIDNPHLSEENRLRSHNQFLTTLVGFGIVGLIVFLFQLIYPLFHLHPSIKIVYVAFFIISTFSFLTEDTLETQAGISFFTFFNSLFLLAMNPIQDHTSR